MKKYPFEEKTIEELVEEANRILKENIPEMTEEEERVEHNRSIVQELSLPITEQIWLDIIFSC